jgi:hypothetical protein
MLTAYIQQASIINYIKNRQKHHKQENFRDEIERLFKEQGIDLEQKWFLEDN